MIGSLLLAEEPRDSNATGHDTPHDLDAQGRHAAPAHTIEVVGWFADRDSFKAAVKDLLDQGFARADLSVLDTHESLSVTDSPREAFQEAMSGLVREVNFIGPLAAAGFIAVATGPIGALIAGATGVGLAGYAVADILDEVRATPHTEEFARAAENGALLLWVRAESPPAQDTASDILRAHGARDVHAHERPLRAEEKDSA